MKNILTAVGFSLFYVSLYPILRGGFVIYHYPYWSPPLAAMYVAGGILMQAWFCFGRKRPAAGHMLLAQAVAGVLYAAAIAAFPGGIYLS
jgi:hypothetical protein